MQLDSDFVRSQFPAFSELSLKGWSFFENAGGSYACKQVIDRLTAFYTKTKVQPYYPYPASMEAGRKMDEAYSRLSAYMNVAEDEVNFGPSTTQNIYVLAQALRPLWQAGDEIVVSCQDHEANAGTWRGLEHSGIVIREWHVDPNTGALSLESLDELLSDSTKMVAFPHASNVVAHINPVKAIAERAHQAGAIAVVDGVSYAPHGLPDIGELGTDIYLFSLYKTWGPHLGLMHVRQSLLEQLSNQSHFFNANKPRSKITPAGPDHAQIAAAAGIAEYLDAVYEHHFQKTADSAERGRQLHTLFASHEQALLSPVLEFLKQRDDVRLIGPDDPTIRASTVTFVPLKKNTMDVADALLKEQLMVGTGDFYAVRPLQEMAVELDPGAVRVSFIHYNTMAEIEHLIRGLTHALD